MDPRRPMGGGYGGGGLGLSGPVPRDVWWLLGAVLVTFSFQHFGATALVAALLQLSPAVWARGFVWQVATYPFAGVGPASIWIIVELVILFLFVRDVRLRLGRKSFWLLLAWVCIPSALVALFADGLGRLVAGPNPNAFVLMQGQRMLLTFSIAAFATLNRNATIYLFFVLPIQASWFIPLEILFAFVGFLGSRDVGGFVGVCAAVGLTWAFLSGRGPRGTGRDLWLRLQEWWLRLRMRRLRKKRGFTVVDDDRWLHRDGARESRSGGRGADATFAT